jgi:hypothetical protein
MRILSKETLLQIEEENMKIELSQQKNLTLLSPDWPFLSQAILHAPNPKRKTPGAGRRVNVEHRGQQGEQYIDATTGDIPSKQDSRAFLPPRLRR